MADVVTNVNQKIVGSITNIDWLSILGWIFLGIIVIAGGYWYYTYSRNKKIYNIRITAFKNVNGYWKAKIRDFGKVVKLGKGGFEIIFLQKSKTWKIAYGADDDNDMMFFIQPDKYWVHGNMSAKVNHINSDGGLIPVITTNPLMRSQYTSLEKLIDSLHEDKKGFWDKYGTWVLGIGFVLIAGVMLWLNYKEFAQAMGSMSGITDKLGSLVEQVNNLLSQSKMVITGNSPTGGLVPV